MCFTVNQEDPGNSGKRVCIFERKITFAHSNKKYILGKEVKFRVRGNFHISFANIAKVYYGYLNKANLFSLGHLISFEVKQVGYFPFIHSVPFPTPFVSQETSQCRLHYMVTLYLAFIGFDPSETLAGVWRVGRNWYQDLYLPSFPPAGSPMGSFLPVWRLSLYSSSIPSVCVFLEILPLLDLLSLGC